MAIIPTTWNPADKGSGATLSSGNLRADFTSGTSGSVRSAFGASSGKWYWEVTGSLYVEAGVATSGMPLMAYPDSSPLGFVLYFPNGQKWNNSTGAAYAVAVGSNVVGVLLDLDSLTLSFRVAGTGYGTAYSLPAGTYFAFSGSGSGSVASCSANFGATPFTYTPPAGFAAGFGPNAKVLSGTVRDATGALAARKVAAYREDTNALIGATTSDATTGVYSIETPADTAHTLVFYPAVGENLNALVRRGVLPIEA